MNMWNILRSVISAIFIFAIAWMAVADYPTELQLWQVICSVYTGYLWQFVILFAAWHALIWWTLYWQEKLSGRCPLCMLRR